MIILDILILWGTLKVGFKLIERINRNYSFLPVALFKYLLIYHTFFSFVYHNLTLRGQSWDTFQYYNSSSFKFLPGTNFIKSIAYILTDILPLSYLSTFWVFGLLGFLWMPLIYITIRENMVQSRRIVQLLHVILFIPGLSFWSSAIGKDGLMMFGISCFLFSLNRLTVRKKWLFFGIFLTFMIRPHISALLLVALAIGIVIHSRYLRSKFVLFLIMSAIIIGPMMIIKVFKYLRFSNVTLSDLLNLFEMVTYFLETTRGDLTKGGSVIDLAQYPFIFKVFTFMYRPLFIDANNIRMLFSSFENLIYLGLTVLIVHRYSISFLIKRKSLFYTVNVIFLILFVSILSQSTANMGLAVRHKLMCIPSLLSIIFISQSYYRMVLHKKKQLK